MRAQIRPTSSCRSLRLASRKMVHFVRAPSVSGSGQSSLLRTKSQAQSSSDNMKDHYTDGAPETIRTSGHRFRKAPLYPAELRGQDYATWRARKASSNFSTISRDGWYPPEKASAMMPRPSMVRKRREYRRRSSSCSGC